MPDPDRPKVGSLPKSLRWWLLTLVTLGMVVLTFSLGRWQMGRAQYKLDLAAAIEARTSGPPLRSDELWAQTDPGDLVHRRVVLQGRWIADRTVYLDNRPMAGRQGLWVLTPLQLRDSPRVILVQRGWIARDFQDRQRLAPVQTPEGWVTVEGRLALEPGQLYQLEPQDSGLIRQNLRLKNFQEETGLPLLGVMVVQTGAASEGLLRQWDRPDSGVDKHHGYAFQWFSLSALLVGLYVWFQWIAPRRKQRADA
jgi:surfeit locus 1 family protein